MPSTLLQFAAATQPNPLIASPPAGPANQATVFVLGTNQSAHDAAIEGVSVAIPLGGEGADLTRNGSAISPVPPDGWKVTGKDLGADLATFTFAPATTGGGVVPARGSVVFSFGGVEVNQTAGSCPLAVTEGSGGCTPGVDCPTATPGVVKVPTGWSEVELSAEPAYLDQGQNTLVSWSGPSGATYTLRYPTPAGTVTVPAPGAPPLAPIGAYTPPQPLKGSTLFTLDVEDVPFRDQRQVMVTVFTPPAIQAYDGALVAGERGPALSLRWLADGAGECTMTLCGAVSNASLDGSFVVPGSRGPVMGAAMTLTATGPGAGGPLTSRATVWVGFAPRATVTLAEYANGLAFLPDGTLLVLGMSTLATYTRTNDAKNPFTLAGPPAAIPYPTPGPGPARLTTAFAPARGGARVYVAAGDVGFCGMLTYGATTTPAAPYALLGNPLRAGEWPIRAGTSPDGSLAYMLDAAPAAVWAFQAQNDPGAPLVPLGSPCAVGGTPWTLTVAPNGTLLVTDVHDNAVIVLAPTGLAGTPLAAVGPPLPVGGVPTGAAVSPDGAWVYVPTQGGTVALLRATGDPSTPYAVVGISPVVGQSLGAVAVTPDGACVFVADRLGNTVAMLTQTGDPAAPLAQVGDAIPFDGTPIDIAVSPDGTMVVVASGMQLTVLAPASISGGSSAASAGLDAPAVLAS